jgi:predicted RNase H-like HicB family nuclease
MTMTKIVTYDFTFTLIGKGETLEEAFENCKKAVDELEVADVDFELMETEEYDEPIDYARENPRDDDVSRYPFKP